MINHNNFDLRLDQQINDKDSVFARYSFETVATNFPAVFGPVADGGDFFSRIASTHYHSLALGETHIFTSHVVNEFRFGYNRIYSNRLQPAYNSDIAQQIDFPGIPVAPSNGGLPQLTFSDVSTIGSSLFLPTRELQNTYIISENLSWVLGNHSLRFGAEIDRNEFAIYQPAEPRGTLDFGTQFTDNPGSTTTGTGGSGFASFLLGIPDTGSITNAINIDYFRPSWNFYVQDDWKVNNKLTLNYGLRYELYQTVRERNNHEATYDLATQTLIVPKSQPTTLTPQLAAIIPVSATGSDGLIKPDLNNFAPRVGFAYSLTPKSVLRAGYGFFYGGSESGPYSNPSPGYNPPYYRTNSYSPNCSLGSANPAQTDCSITDFSVLSNGFPTNALSDPNTPLLYSLDPHLVTPYVQQYQLSTEYQLPANLLFTAAYAGSHGLKLYTFFNGNEATPSADPTADVASRRPIPSIDAPIQWFRSSGRSNYNALEVSLARSASSGLSLLAAYTYAHGLDNASAANLGSQNGGDFRDFRHPEAEYGNSDTDVRHRFTLSYLYPLPVGQGQRFLASSGKALDAVVGHWQIGGIITLSTGNWYTATDAVNFSNVPDGGGNVGSSQRPDFAGNPNSKPCLAGTYFNTCAFTDPAQGSFGTVNRNTIAGPGTEDVDFSAFKLFHLGERLNLEFRSEFFNILNHYNPLFALRLQARPLEPRCAIPLASVSLPRPSHHARFSSPLSSRISQDASFKQQHDRPNREQIEKMKRAAHLKQLLLPRILGLIVAAVSSLAVASAEAQLQDVSLKLSTSATDGSYTLSVPGLATPVLRASAAVKLNGKWLHAKDYPKHTVDTTSISGELGPAQVITIRYTGRDDAPDLLLKLRTYTNAPFGDMQLTASNTTGRPIELQSLRVLEAESESKSKPHGDALLNLGGPATADRVLSDSFSEDRPAMQLRDLSNVENHVHRAVGVQLLYNQQSKQSWFIGALTSDKFLSVLRLNMAPSGHTAMTSYEVDSTGTTELLTENSLQNSPAIDRVELSLNLAPGAELSSERMLFSVSNDYHNQLETYARLIRELHHARVTASTPIGWWSWTAYYFGLNQGTALTNAQWLSQHLKSLGYNFFHMDEGYQFARGEYATPDASLFPQGVAALERQVMNEGLTPGIWTAPFEVSERSWIFTHHPEWLVHNAQGEPIHIGLVTDGVDHLYALDTTHPDAQAYLRSTYSTLVNNWGIRYIKMDFMEDSAVEGFYHVPQTTALEAQRIGIQTIRDAVGPNVLLDKDGCELLNPVGLVDMGRISQDTGHTFSSSKDAASGIAARYYMNRNYFLADPDAFSVSAQTVDDQSWHGGAKPLTLDEAKVSIALSAVSGGLYEIGDDLPTLGEAADRIALVENRDLLDMARLGRASTPLDLMTYEAADLQPSLFLLKETSRQTIITVFNWSDIIRSRSLTRAMLQLDPKANYAVSEVLSKIDDTPLTKSLDIQQPPHSVRIFKIVDTTIPAQVPAVTATVASSGEAGEAIDFLAKTADDHNPVLHYTWDFGDGVTVEGAKAIHTYTHAGVYTAHLQAAGFAPDPHVQAFSITITGSVSTKFMPQTKRRFVESQP